MYLATPEDNTMVEASRIGGPAAVGCPGLNTKTLMLPQLEDLERLQEAITQGAEAYSSLRRYKTNSTILLHTLPAELFREILVQTLLAESDGTANTWKHVHKLASVSKHWYETVVSEPRLWTKITSYDPPKVTSAKLRNSKAVELDVELDFVWRIPSMGLDEEEWFADAVSGVSHRWGSLVLRCTQCPRWVYRALDGSASVLRDLCVQLPWEWFGSGEDRIDLGDEGTTLRRLRLQSVGLVWDSPRLSNLQFLCLINISTHAPTLGQLRAILRSSPGLQTLDLINVTARADSPPGDASAIPLPHLKSFKLQGMSPDVMSNLVSSIHAARSCAVLLRPFEATSLTSPALQTALLRWVEGPFRAAGNIFLSVDGNMKQVNIQTSGSPHSEVCKPELWPEQSMTGALFTVLFEKEDLTPIRHVVEILKASNTAAVVHLSVRGEDAREFPVEILDDLDGLQQMTVLDSATEAIIEHLAHPKRSENGDWCWPCPNLTTLKVELLDEDRIAALRSARRGCQDGRNEVLPRELFVDCLENLTSRPS